MDEQKIVEILLEFGIKDGDKAKQAADALKKVERNAVDAKKRVNEMRESMEKLQQVGTTLATTGAAILAPFVASASKYVQVAGKAEKESSKWLDSTSRLEESQLRLGRATASILNPALEKTATIAERMVSAVERNPQILQAVMALGGGLVGVGAMLTVVSQVGRMIANMQALSMQGGAAGVAGKAGMALGQVTLLATSVIIGAEVGALIGNAIAEKIYGPGYKQQSIADAIITALKAFSTPFVGAAKVFAEVQQKFGGSVDWFNKGVGNLNSFLNALGLLLNGTPLIGSGDNGGGGSGPVQRENTEKNSADKRTQIVAEMA